MRINNGSLVRKSTTSLIIAIMVLPIIASSSSGTLPGTYNNNGVILSITAGAGIIFDPTPNVGFGYEVLVYNYGGETVNASYYAVYYNHLYKFNDTDSFRVLPGYINGGGCFISGVTLSPILVHLEAANETLTRTGFVVMGFVVFLTRESGHM